MTTCKFCQKESKLISETLEVCRDCLLHGNWNKIKDHIMAVHKRIRNSEG